jgi:hypothetical protein
LCPDFLSVSFTKGKADIIDEEIEPKENEDAS